MTWRIHHKEETISTNLDAREGRHGDVYTADFQTAGRGRLDHKWLSPPKTNLMMSVVLSVADLSPDHVATLPLVAGLAVCKAIQSLLSLRHLCAPLAVADTGLAAKGTQGGRRVISLKWPNDVFADGRKIAGMLCERNGDTVIVGIGVNVGQAEFPPELADRATSLVLLASQAPLVLQVRDAVLHELGKWYEIWRERGFAAVYSEIAAVDCLRGREIAVRQTDGDSAPVTGVSGGIMPDGSLDVGGVKVYAGEAHVEKT